MPIFLQRQRLVEDEPTGASEAAHLPLLQAVWPEFVLKGLKSLHGYLATLRRRAVVCLLGSSGNI